MGGILYTNINYLENFQQLVGYENVNYLFPFVCGNYTNISMKQSLSSLCQIS